MVDYDYEPFFETLKERGLSRYAACKEYDIPDWIMRSLRDGANMEIVTLVSIMWKMKIFSFDKVARIRFK